MVRPPELAPNGCTYVINNTIPAGEPQGIKPTFPPFDPDQSAVTALQAIEKHGGTGMVDGFTLPSGTTLYAGPETTQPSVGTVSSGNSILAAAPVLWTTHPGGDWLAFFIACGGENLYWVSVKQLVHQNPKVGASVAATIARLKAAVPYDKSGKASILPILIKNKQLVWADPKVTTTVGRGLLLGYP